MRGRCAALPLLLVTAIGCQFQVAINPIGPFRSKEDVTPEQTDPVSNSTIVADADTRPRWKATRPEDQIRRLTASHHADSKPTRGSHAVAQTTPDRIIVRKPVSNELAHVPTTGLTAAWFATPTSSADKVNEQVEQASLELPPAPASEPERLDTEAQSDPGKPIPAAPVLTPPINGVSEVETSGSTPTGNQFPVNLTAVLQLAGAENWRIHLAAERVREAQANLDEAQVAWLPSLVAGVGYTKHDGQIQATNGDIVDVSRNALFVGGGARSGQAPVAGAAGGPARLQVDLSLTDALYRPLVARQVMTAEQFRQSATFNDTLLDAAVAYYDLVLATGRAENLRDQDIPLARELLVQTKAFVSAGKGSKADVTRIQTELTQREQSLVEADAQVHVAAAELARILQLDPETSLFVLEDRPVAIDMVEPAMSVAELVATGVETRPELGERYARIEAGEAALESERWRPFLPNLSVGASAGAFGGGTGDTIQGLDGRADFDIAAVWEVRNLGFGHAARQAQEQSRYQQSLYRYHATRDGIVAEITQAYHQTQSQRKQIKLAESRVSDAFETFELSKARIRGLAGLPLEALQAVQAVADARQNLLEAVVGYNQSQFRLMRAIGGPIQVAE